MANRPELRLENMSNLKGMKLRKFDGVREEVAKHHDLLMPDRVIDMSTIKVTPDMHLEVPGFGVLEMNDWSKGQLGRVLGVNWERWFEPKIKDPDSGKLKPFITAEIVQEEISRRFNKTQERRLLRAKRWDNPALAGKTDGYLRAVLGPNYTSIDDERIFDRIEKKFGDQINEFQFAARLQQSTEQKTVGSKPGWWTQRSSHYSILTPDPIDMGPIDFDDAISGASWRRVAEIHGNDGRGVPDRDYCYAGLHIRNSEVGYCAVTVDEEWFRIICLNGMITNVKDGRLLYRQHRRIENEQIDSLLDGVFRNVTNVWDRSRILMEALKIRRVADPEKEINTFLKSKGAPKGFADAVHVAYKDEPNPTKYGILQAITRAAQAEKDSDKRFDYEAFGGIYLRTAEKN